MTASELAELIDPNTPCIVFTDVLGFEDIDGMSVYPDALEQETGGLDVLGISLEYIGESARLGIRVG